MRLARLPGREFRSSGYRSAVRTPYFIVKAKENTAHKWRAGVVAGVGLHKSAVKRNFWKRQARETLAASLTERAKLPGGRTWDILIVLQPKTAALTKKQFRETLRAAARSIA